MGGDASERGAGVGTAVATLALFVATLAAYWWVPIPERYNHADPLLTTPTSLSILRDGDLDLSEYAAEIDPDFHGVVFLAGRPYNRYPIGTAVVILPIVWATERWLPRRESAMADALAVAAVAAKVLAALSVALLFVVGVELTGRPAIALALALVLGFATVHLPIHAGGLFTHNAVIPSLLLALWLVLRRDGRHAALAAVPLVLAFATRPTCVPAIAGIAAYVGLVRPEAFRPFVAIGAALGALFVAWSRWEYGTTLPPYYTAHDDTVSYVFSAARFAEGLAGHLLSPNRGLLVFTPLLAFALWGMIAAWRLPLRHAALHRTLAAIVVVQWVMISLMARKWWAGWSFGPRHLAEVVPFLVLLLVPALEAARATSPRVRGLLAPVAAAALAWSLFVAVRGATSAGPPRWNRVPANVDLHPERVWDWRDLQILRSAATP